MAEHRIEHQIVLELTEDGHALPSLNQTITRVGDTLKAQVGDTLRFDTNPPGCPFRVEIAGSPFTKKQVLVIKDRRPRKLTVEGRFFWKCFLRRDSDKQFVGWFWGENPESGGDVDVRP
jgi:hypothetical protein